MPGKPFTTLIISTRRANHKYSEFMDFMRWRSENVKGVLVWSFTGKQTGIVRSLLKGRVIAVSTLLGRWMYTMKIQQSRPNHPHYIAVNKKVSDSKLDMFQPAPVEKQ